MDSKSPESETTVVPVLQREWGVACVGSAGSPENGERGSKGNGNEDNGDDNKEENVSKPHWTSLHCTALHGTHALRASSELDIVDRSRMDEWRSEWK